MSRERRWLCTSVQCNDARHQFKHSCSSSSAFKPFSPSSRMILGFQSSSTTQQIASLSCQRYWMIPVPRTELPENLLIARPTSNYSTGRNSQRHVKISRPSNVASQNSFRHASHDTCATKRSATIFCLFLRQEAVRQMERWALKTLTLWCLPRKKRFVCWYLFSLPSIF